MGDNIDEKLERLAAYERMHADMVERFEKFSAQVDERKAAGRMKGATGNQLLAQKMTYKNMVTLYESYGLSAPE